MMTRPTGFALAFTASLALATLLTTAPLAVAQGGNAFRIQQIEGGLRIERNGQLVTEYRTDLGPKPILYPLLDTDGVKMTRSYPMEKVEGERTDHPHHRSFWFTHGNVNGIDFWSEVKNHGSIKHRDFTKVSSGSAATIETVNDWLGPDGKKVMEDARRLTIRQAGDLRMLDFDITFTASEGAVTFGDTKEGSFGVRVPSSMDVDRGNGGRIVNSEGQTDKGAWGQPASWVDYHGPVEGKTRGLAIMNHPSSFRYPTHWHVRTYGLFAANPFGHGGFKSKVADDGTYVLPEGESMTLHYRVVLHPGNAQAAGVEKLFADYAELEKKPVQAAE